MFVTGVLVGMKVVDSEGNTSEYGDLDLPELWSVIMIHEPVEGGQPYGVVEISNLEYEENSSYELLRIVAFLRSFRCNFGIYSSKKIPKCGRRMNNCAYLLHRLV